MNSNQLPDEMLLHQIAKKDTNAFESLYDRHGQTIYNVVMRIVNDPSVADEVVQETFWQVWKRSADYRGTGAAAAWVYRIARNKSLDYVRKRKREQPYFQPAYEESSQRENDGPRGTPLTNTPLTGTKERSPVEHEVSQQIEQQHLMQALASIPSEQRLCLELAYFEGMSQSAISERLVIPLGTVKTRIRMGLEKLEHILRAAGFQEGLNSL